MSADKITSRETPRTDRMVASWPLESFGEMTGLARQLERENAALREQLATMTQAVGLASTIKSEMPMRPDDPIGMMQEIVAAVAAIRAQLAERDAKIAALKGHAEAMAERLDAWARIDECKCSEVDAYRRDFPKEEK